MFALQGFFILAFPCIWFQWSPTKNLHPREALLHLGHQRIDCTWFRRAFYACYVISQGFLCLLLHILWSSFTIFDHHVFLVHLLISASWLRSENHNCPTAGISEQACLSQCLCSNILRQFKQSNYSSLPHDVEWRNIFSVMEQSSWMKMHLSKTVNMYSIII